MAPVKKTSRAAELISAYFKKQNTVVSVILAVAIQAGALCLLESFFYSVSYINFAKYLFNLVFWLTLAALFTFVTGSLRWGSFITTLFSAVLGTAEYMVMIFRDSPILPWDLLSFGTAMSVVGNYKFEFTPRIFWIYLAYLILIALCFLITLKVTRRKLLIRLCGALLSVCLIAGFVAVSQSESFQEAVDYYPYLFTPKAIYKRNGFAFSFCSLLKYINPQKPSGYDESALETLADGIRSEAESEKNAPGAEFGVDGKMPNIIIIMNEAFSDLSVLGNVDCSEDYMPYFRSLCDSGSAIHGYVYSSVSGGNTANSEYEFLSGDSMAFLPSGSIPYQQYIKSGLDTYIATLKDLGYHTVAMHPYNATGWDRDVVYERFGFDSIYFRSAFGKADLRGYVSDLSCFRKLIKIYESEKEQGPFFTFCVTMQNHGGYSDSTDYKNFDQKIKSSFSDGVSSYLSLIKYSDEALKYIVDYFSKKDEPTLICMFGDHLPTTFITNPVLRANGIDPTAETDAGNFSKLYQVPFIIWSNYFDELSEEERFVEATSFNYLNVYVSEAANIPLSPYQKYLAGLRSEYPVITANFVKDAKSAGGGFRYISEAGDDAGLLTYRQFAYNHLFGKEKVLESFFK